MSDIDGASLVSANPVLLVRSGEGSAKWVAGDAYTMKAVTADTEGTFSFFEAVVPPGGGPPLHAHRHENEAFYILDGELAMTADDRTFTAGKGDFVLVPRGHRHRFANVGQADAVMLFMYSPGGFERFFIETGDDPVPDGKPEPWPLERIMAVAPASEAVGMEVYPDLPDLR